MRKLLIIVIITIFTTRLVCCDQSVQTNLVNEQINKQSNVHQNSESIKTKRGTHGFAGLRYLPPAPSYNGLNYIRHTPYSSFPGRIYTRPAGPAYALTPGNAVVHSYNVNYPRIYHRLRPSIPAPLPPTVLIHTKPIVPPVPVYPINRYPVYVPRPIVPLPPVPQFGVPNFLPTIPPHVHTANSIPVPIPVPFPLQPTPFISENGWKPLYSPIPTISNAIPTQTIPHIPHISSHSHLNLVSPSPPHRPSNFYLPVDPLPAHDVIGHSKNHENGIQFVRLQLNAIEITFDCDVCNQIFYFCRTLSAK